MWQCSVLLLVSALFTLTPADPNLQDVECIYFNMEYMTCMWNSQGRPAGNYSLYYWYRYNESSAVECRRYLQDGDINIGCWFNRTELTLFRPFAIRVNGSLGSEEVNLKKEMRLQDRVKLEPPTNLTIVSMNNNQLLLKWESSYEKKQCVEFKIKYTNNKETKYTEQPVENQFQFSYSSVDPEKYYTFYVSAKVYWLCATTDQWSEWSLPIHWGKNPTKGNQDDSTSYVVISLVSSLLFIVIIVTILRIERIWVIIVPRIPNPSKNFEELFNTHNGNFSEWVGVSKDVMERFKPSLNETICHVSEVPLHKSSGQLNEDVKMASGTIPRTNSGHKYIFSSAPTSTENLCPENDHQLALSKNRYVKV